MCKMESPSFVDTQHQSDDAQWLNEVLGLNANNVVDGINGAPWEWQYNNYDAIEELLADQGPSNMLQTNPWANDKLYAPDGMEDGISTTHERGVIRRNKVELIIESQRETLEYLCSKLETCRLKVRVLLERFIDPNHKDGPGLEHGEGNIRTMQELNELLLSSIKVAKERTADQANFLNDSENRCAVPMELFRERMPPQSGLLSHAAKNKSNHSEGYKSDGGRKTLQDIKHLPKLIAPASVDAHSSRSFVENDDYTHLANKCVAADLSAELIEKKPYSISFKSLSAVDGFSPMNSPGSTQSSIITVHESIESYSDTKQAEKTTPFSSHKLLLSTESPTSNDVSSCKNASEPTATDNTIDSTKQDKEKMARMLEEARHQVAAARKKKKEKKANRVSKWIQEQEELKRSRVKSWEKRIAKENDYMELVRKLIVHEFLRQSKRHVLGLNTSERVLSDPQASLKITKESRQALHIFFGDLKPCRVLVAASNTKDINDRIGTLRYWDKGRGKFCVGLDTKKSPDSDVRFFSPENLEWSSCPSSYDTANTHQIDIPCLLTYGGASLGICFTLHKNHVIALGSAESTKIGLQVFNQLRDEDECRSRLEEESQKDQEEEDCKQHASVKRENTRETCDRKHQPKGPKKKVSKNPAKQSREDLCRNFKKRETERNAEEDEACDILKDFHRLYAIHLTQQKVKDEIRDHLSEERLDTTTPCTPDHKKRTLSVRDMADE